MDLFSNELHNYLPKDGVVNYFGTIFSLEEARHYYDTILNQIAWKNEEGFIFGKHYITKRKMAWHADENFGYTYAKTTKKASYFTKELLEIKHKIESITNETYNSCLLNLYHNGNEGMSWHSDNEKNMKPNGAIASVSLGASRKFGFKHKITKETIYLLLESGSLLLMKGDIQEKWLHSLPLSKKVTTPRINLTFRTFVK